MNTKTISNYIQKYRQAPWRTQLQWLIVFVLGLVVAGMIAGLYESVSARAAVVGREVRSLNIAISDGERVNADQESQLAELMSAQRMRERAHALGFEPMEPDNIIYVPVSGYTLQAVTTITARTTLPSMAITPPEYTQSLFEWFVARIQASPSAIGDRP